VEDNDNPTWDQYLLTAPGGEILAKFEAEVKDDDWPVDQSLGQCKAQVMEADLAAGTVTTECGTTTSMGFHRTCWVTFSFQPL
jgi:hypothetical protein